MTRPPERRPAHDTIDNIADWLLESPRNLFEGIASFDEFAWRLVAAGIPFLRVTLHTATTRDQPDLAFGADRPGFDLKAFAGLPRGGPRPLAGRSWSSCQGVREGPAG
jgi:hypothetical protein